MSGSGSTVIGVARDDAQALAVKKSLACPAIIAHTLE
jgi:4-diphosphocytidyl-2C-methyl-D-erythritol kinase